VDCLCRSCHPVLRHFSCPQNNFISSQFYTFFSWNLTSWHPIPLWRISSFTEKKGIDLPFSIFYLTSFAADYHPASTCHHLTPVGFVFHSRKRPFSLGTCILSVFISLVRAYFFNVPRRNLGINRLRHTNRYQFADCGLTEFTTLSPPAPTYSNCPIINETILFSAARRLRRVTQTS